MRHLSKYETYIFDCDGVLLDSNLLKIDAMGKALKHAGVDHSTTKLCLQYFASNFGKSRYHHVWYFCESILGKYDCTDEFKKIILTHFNDECDTLYFKADKTAFVDDALHVLKGDRYVASGSEQGQLRRVLLDKFPADMFIGVYGSPTSKLQIVEGILDGPAARVDSVLVGDSLADLNVAVAAGIDFVGYLPYSNTPDLLKTECVRRDFPVLDSWSI